jgi:carboxypeptidase Q
MNSHSKAFLMIFLFSYPLLLLAASASLADQVREDDIVRSSDQLISAVLTSNSAMTYLEELSDRHGSRITGTREYQRASEWAAERFRAAGIANVHLESFTIPNSWKQESASARLISPVEREIHLASFGWSPSTPPGLAGEVVWLDDYSLNEMQAEREKIRNHIVIVSLVAFFTERRNAYSDFRASFKKLKDLGALALLVICRDPENVLMALPLSNGAEIVELPIAEVGLEDGLLIKRWIEKGPVKVELNLRNQSGGPAPVNNIVAEIPGREKPDEWIVVGAHFDAWDYGTGAQDNGSGAAMVYEAARAIQALGRPPRRSIRFVLWGGEEQGILGSRAYVRAHAAELNRCIAALVTDSGAGHPRGWDVSGRQDLLEAMKPISKTLTGLDGDGLLEELRFGSDHGAFVLEGIPVIELWTDESHYEEIHHKPADTLDKVNAHNLQDGAAVVAVTAYAIAEMQRPIAPHIDHAAVEEILKKAKLAEYLKENGIWY